MWPKQHGLVSAVFVCCYSLLFASSVVQGGIWIIAGTLAGVLIDTDHVILGIVVKKRYDAVSWFKKPLEAMLNPGALLDDIEYPRLIYHRTVTHGFMILVSMAFLAWPIGQVVFLTLCLHLFCDIIHDIMNTDHWV